MAEFKYLAVDSAGRRTHGRCEAGNVQELISALEGKGLSCLSYEQLISKDRVSTTYRMKTQEIVIFCRQLETMLSAGVTISRVFEILCDKAANKKQGQLYRNVYEELQKGQTLSGAMLSQGRSFPMLLVHMISSGEASGALDTVTKRMSEHFTNDLKLSQKLRTAMVYPGILLAVSLAVIVLLFTVVLPKLFALFEGAELPLMTRVLMWISNFVVNRWIWIIVFIVILAVVAMLIYNTSGGRYMIDKLKLKLPKIGKLMRIVYTARFANSMATLYASGIPVMRALEFSCEILDNAYYSKGFAAVLSDVESGRSLSEALGGSNLFDQMFLSLVFVGEESGSLDNVLNEAAKYYDSEAQVALERMVALLEPTMIIVLAVIIGFIVAATILPIYDMYGQIS